MARTAQVIIVSSVMFTFISYWRTAAVVLCDLASTAYYIGGIVEQAIGPAAPWFILGVMLFSYAVRSVYIESCSLFVRGGVYKVVKQAMGGFLGKLSVSALMFDYILTGPTSGVSAGQYIMGMLLDALRILLGIEFIGEARDDFRRWGAVVIACAVTLYFFWQNLRGIHESSGKALNIMIATTIMAGVILLWCVVTLVVRGPVNSALRAPDLRGKVEYRLAAYYQLTPGSLEALGEAGIPPDVLDHLTSLKGQLFESETLFTEAVIQKIGADAWKKYQTRLLTLAMVADDFEWTPSAQEAVRNLVSPEVIDKLNPLIDRRIFRRITPHAAALTAEEIEKEREAKRKRFTNDLRERLTPEEFQQYRFLLVREAAQPTVTDRVTHEKRTLLARDPKTTDLLPQLEWEKPDPETGEIRPRLDANGKEIVVARINPATGRQDDPRGMLTWLAPGFARALADSPVVSFIGIIGLFLAFGHSILAMSGEETLAQVYREVESPKLKNFKKAAFIVFVYSLLLTASISFLAVMLIPDEVRMKDYSDNLIGGLAMYVWGHAYARLALNAFVVVVGFLILAGAVNTAIIGSNGVLNRVAEDGVLPDWFLKPHPRYGTSYRLLYMIVGMQLAVILVSRGDMLILGEAYAFGVVWSFVFKALAMVVLRFRDHSHREYKVPLNIKIGNIEIPMGLILIFLILLCTALINLFTKEVATFGGLIFTGVFLTTFLISEYAHERRQKAAGKHHEHVEQFNRETTSEITPESLGLTKSYRKLVSIRSTQNLFMLEKALDETDPETTGVVVMTAKYTPPGGGTNTYEQPDLDAYDQQLMTAVVERAEKAGKEVKPVIIPTNNPLHAVLNTAKDLQAHELILGASNKYTADEQLEQIAFYWISLHEGQTPPLTVRILSRERDMYLDLAGGNRIPKISERRARTVAELRAAGVGVDRVLLIHDGSPGNSDLFQSVLTMLDPDVVLGIASVVPAGADPHNGHSVVHQDEERARQLGRVLPLMTLRTGNGAEIVERARKEQYDLIVLLIPSESPINPLGKLDERAQYIVRHSHCRVFLATTPGIPQEVVDNTPSHA
jgi:amino acid transporter/nucleotide-binding universal stress UspA family protein